MSQEISYNGNYIQKRAEKFEDGTIKADMQLNYTKLHNLGKRSTLNNIVADTLA